MYWFTSKERERKDYFPSLIYYYASPHAIEKHRERSLTEKEREEKRRGHEKMERGKMERKEKEELERLKGIYKKKDAYSKKVREIMQNFLKSLSASLDKETERSTIEKVAEEIFAVFLDIDTVSLDQKVIIKG